MKKKNLQDQEIAERNHFDSLSNLYDKNYFYNTPFNRYKIEKKVFDIFSPIKKNGEIRILEVGAGTGEYTQYIAQLFPKAKIVAIDISPEILKLAKKKCKKYKNVEFQAASAYKLPFRENSFDLVCGFYILHHLDLKATAKEICRVLKPESKALFYEPNLLNPVVFLIKSVPFLKKKAGDSEDEWAINPLTLDKDMKPLKLLRWKTSEFIAIPSFFNLGFSISLDRLMALIGSLPIINFFGGSISVSFLKKQDH